MIRAASPADVTAILGMIHELAEYERSAREVLTTHERLHDALFAPGARVHAQVAVEDGLVVGFALWFVSYSTWRGVHGVYVEDLFIRPKHRRGGHGRALLTTLAELCLRRGYARLEWSVLDWNEPSIGFYRSLGAVPLDEWTVYRLTDGALQALGADQFRSD